MPKLSQFFCAAVAGHTTDGRVIEESWIDDMVATYSRATYGARINLEHIRGYSPDAPFNAYGDVAAVQKRTVDIKLGNATVTKPALFIQVEGHDALVALAAKGQKIYPSLEVSPNFANTGKAYLVGLGMTDNPASLGTEVIKFAATQGDNNPLKARKLKPENLIAEVAEGVVLTFTDAPTPAPPESTGLFAAATAFFAQFGKTAAAELVSPTPPTVPPAPANDNGVAALSAIIGEGFTKMNLAMTAMSTETTASIAGLRADHDALKLSIATTDGGGAPRPLATGGNGNFAATDC